MLSFEIQPPFFHLLHYLLLSLEQFYLPTQMNSLTEYQMFLDKMQLSAQISAQIFGSFKFFLG